MLAEFNVLVTCPDEDENGDEAVLRVRDRMLAISRYFQHNQAVTG